MGYLCVSDPLHASENGVKEDNSHADQDAIVDTDVEESREHNANPAHLAGNVSKGDEDCAQDSYEAGCLRVIAIADEVGNRVFA